MTHTRVELIKQKRESIRRLKILAKFFRHFRSDHSEEQLDLSIFAEQGSCGTVACVAGWAGLIPEFREQGLKTNTNDNSLRYFQPEQTVYGTEAFRRFFGLNGNETDDVCLETCYLRCMPDWINDLPIGNRYWKQRHWILAEARRRLQQLIKARQQELKDMKWKGQLHD